MQTKHIQLGTSYARKEHKYKSTPDQVWVLSPKTYRQDTAPREQEQVFMKVEDRKTGNGGYRYEYGLLAIVADGWYAARKFTPEVVALLDKVTVEDVLGLNGGLPKAVLEALKEVGASAAFVEVKVIQPRQIIQPWDEYHEQERQRHEAQQEYQAEVQARNEEEKARMTEVIRVLNQLLVGGESPLSPWGASAPYSVNEFFGTNDSLTVGLADLETLVGLLKHDLPGPTSK